MIWRAPGFLMDAGERKTDYDHLVLNMYILFRISLTGVRNAAVLLLIIMARQKCLISMEKQLLQSSGRLS